MDLAVDVRTATIRPVDHHVDIAEAGAAANVGVPGLTEHGV
jgi:hypothetical protein